MTACVNLAKESVAFCCLAYVLDQGHELVTDVVHQGCLKPVSVDVFVPFGLLLAPGSYSHHEKSSYK